MQVSADSRRGAAGSSWQVSGEESIVTLWDWDSRLAALTQPPIGKSQWASLSQGLPFSAGPCPGQAGGRPGAQHWPWDQLPGSSKGPRQPWHHFKGWLHTLISGLLYKAQAEVA